MKKYALALASAMFLLTSCSSHDMIEDNTVMEDYTRAFIKRYGLIDSNHTWNNASSSTLTLVPERGKAQNFDIFVMACGNYYLAASYSDIDSPIDATFEVPSGTDTFYVGVDGSLYPVKVGSMLDLNKGSRAEEGEDSDTDADDTPGNVHDYPTAYNNLGWLIAAEDLGSTDDFDFNDVIAKIEYENVQGSFTPSAINWEEVTNGVNIQKIKSRDTDNSTNARGIRVTAMAAGGTLPVWLHFVGKDNVDYILSPNAENGYIKASDAGKDNYTYEWHEWFYGKKTNVQTPTLRMINTGQSAGTGRQIVIPNSILPDGYTFGGYSISHATINFNTDNIQGFYIEVGEKKDGEGKTIISATKEGAAPQMFLIPDIGWGKTNTRVPQGWLWPTERTDIGAAYKYFSAWVSDQSENVKWATEEQAKEADVFQRKY